MPSPLTADTRIYVAGHGGLAGSAIWRTLAAAGFGNLVGHRSAELDLRDRSATMDAVREAAPDVLVMAAAKVGGIGANQAEPVEFLEDNLRIQTNLFQACHAADVPRVLFLGSSCIYPRQAGQPIVEEALLTGPLEPTNEAYAIAKISGIIAVQSYRRQYGRAWISVMPTNLYGPGDNFDLPTAHVLPALIARFVQAKRDESSPVVLWGSGSPRREFLHADDLASAVVFLLQHYDGPVPLNVGSGRDITIRSLAELIASCVGYEGEIGWDTSKPDGTPRKLLDVDRITALGWRASIPLRDGIEGTVQWYRQHHP